MKTPIPSAAVFIVNERNEVLTGYRVRDDVRCIPGGKIDLGQPAIEAVIRETKEETGLDIEIVGFLTYGDDLLRGGHFITLYFQGKVVGGTLTVTEPGKICDFRWCPVDKTGSLFTGCERVLPLLALNPTAS